MNTGEDYQSQWRPMPTSKNYLPIESDIISSTKNGLTVHFACENKLKVRLERILSYCPDTDTFKVLEAVNAVYKHY